MGQGHEGFGRAYRLTIPLRFIAPPSMRASGAEPARARKTPSPEGRRAGNWSDRLSSPRVLPAILPAGKSLENLRAKGMNVNEITPAEQVRMRDKVKPVYEKNASVIGEDTVKLMMVELEKIRK